MNAELAAEIMDAQAQLMDAAIRQVLVHVPSNELDVVVHQDDQSLRLIARGATVYVITMNLLSAEPSVSGEWLMWPPPERRFTWDDIDISNAPMFGD